MNNTDPFVDILRTEDVSGGDNGEFIKQLTQLRTLKGHY